MGLYKLATGALLAGTLLMAAFSAGYKAGTAKHDRLAAQVQAELLSQYQAAASAAKEYEEISRDYYEKYQAAISREPATVTERVFVKAHCPDPGLPTNTDTRVGEANQPHRAELQRETVERITALADLWQADLLKCEAQRNSLLSKIKAYNASR